MAQCIPRRGCVRTEELESQCGVRLQSHRLPADAPVADRSVGCRKGTARRRAPRSECDRAGAWRSISLAAGRRDQARGALANGVRCVGCGWISRRADVSTERRRTDETRSPNDHRVGLTERAKGMMPPSVCRGSRRCRICDPPRYDSSRTCGVRPGEYDCVECTQWYSPFHLRWSQPGIICSLLRLLRDSDTSAVARPRFKQPTPQRA